MEATKERLWVHQNVKMDPLKSFLMSVVGGAEHDIFGWSQT